MNPDADYDYITSTSSKTFRVQLMTPLVNDPSLSHEEDIRFYLTSFNAPSKDIGEGNPCFS